MENALETHGSELGERITLIVPSLTQAAFELHRQNMWEKGYRLESKIQSQTYFESDGRNISSLFDGRTMFAATFVRRTDSD